jgi:benzaldehyde dehydrogenase (NAD)
MIVLDDADLDAAVSINDHPVISMGGTGKSGHGSRFGSTTNLDEFTEWQWIIASEKPVRCPF